MVPRSPSRRYSALCFRCDNGATPFLKALINLAVNGPSPRKEEQRPKTFASPDAQFKVIAGDSFFAMTFNADADPDALPDLARERCGTLFRCTVIGWTDP